MPSYKYKMPYIVFRSSMKKMVQLQKFQNVGRTSEAITKGKVPPRYWFNLCGRLNLQLGVFVNP